MVKTREQMLARAKEAIDRVEVERKDYKGSCQSCRYYTRKNFYLDEICKHPIVQTASLMINQGYKREDFVKTDHQRSSKGISYSKNDLPLCGPNGALFEPKPMHSFFIYLASKLSSTN